MHADLGGQRLLAEVPAGAERFEQMAK